MVLTEFEAVGHETPFAICDEIEVATIKQQSNNDLRE